MQKNDHLKLKQDIGKRVKVARGMLGLTQTAMADRCGLGVGTVSEVESGKTMISAEFMLALYVQFKVEPAWLLSENGGIFVTPNVSNPTEERELLERIKHGIALIDGIVRERMKRYE